MTDTGNPSSAEEGTPDDNYLPPAYDNPVMDATDEFDTRPPGTNPFPEGFAAEFPEGFAAEAPPPSYEDALARLDKYDDKPPMYTDMHNDHDDSLASVNADNDCHL